MTTTLATLRTRVRQQADMVGSEFVSDTEIDTYLNQGWRELYGILVTRSEDYFMADPVEFTLTSSDAGKKAVAADFFKLSGADKQIGSRWIALKPFMFSERNREGGLERGYSTNLRYRLLGSKLHFSPADLAIGTFRYWYIPSPATMDSDDDTIDGVNGWEEYAVLHATIKCLQKEESDASLFLAQKQQLRMEIEAQAVNRDEGSPERIQDVRRHEYWDDDDEWGW